MKKCEKCNKVYEDGFEHCPNCGELLQPAPEEVQSNNLTSVENNAVINNTATVLNETVDTTPENKHKKLIIIASALLLLIIAITSVVLIRQHTISQQQISNVVKKIDAIGDVETTDEYAQTLSSAFEDYKKLSQKQKAKVINYKELTDKSTQYSSLKYKDTLVAAANRLSTAEFYAEYLASDVMNAWHNAIFKKFDKYNNGDYNFNTAIQAYYDDASNAESINNFKTASKAKLDELIKELQSPPTEYKEVYNALLNVYGTFSSVYELSVNPTGSYSTFSSQVNELKNTFASQYGILKALLPEIANSPSDTMSSLESALS